MSGEIVMVSLSRKQCTKHLEYCWLKISELRASQKETKKIHEQNGLLTWELSLGLFLSPEKMPQPPPSQQFGTPAHSQDKPGTCLC